MCMHVCVRVSVVYSAVCVACACVCVSVVYIVYNAVCCVCVLHVHVRACMRACACAFGQKPGVDVEYLPLDVGFETGSHRT